MTFLYTNMGTYLFVRHGESNINVSGTLSDETDKNPLTETGVKQARRTGEQLKGLKFDGIISSPIKRAYETAKIISEYVNLDVKTDNRLREIGLGNANGHNINEFVDELYKNSHITGDMRKKIEMEDWDKLISRIKDCMNDYNGKYIFVSHSDPIRAISSYYLGFAENDSYGIAIKNASMTVISENNVLCLGAINLDNKIKLLFR